MEVDPPYPSTAGHGGDVRLSTAGDVGTAVIEMEVRGRWTRRLSMDVYLALRECMAEHPSAIIVDLHGLDDLDAASTAMWVAASRAASTLQPPAQLALCLPPTRQLTSHLRRLGAVRFLPIHATMKQARAAVASRLPSINRLHLDRLRPEPSSPTVAGDAVVVACAAWGLPDLLDPSRQIVMELVTNAVTHAGTEMALTMSVRGSGLHVAVHDGDHRLPRLPAAGHGAARTVRGLRMVESRASAWGATPTRDGKVVWALVRPRRGAS
jgi:hypothetical protein